MTDVTDTAALREACEILNDHGYLTKSGKIRSSNLAEAVSMIIEQSVGYADQLEAERQRADAAHKYGSERDSENESLMLTVGRLRVEIAELKGDQKPYGYYSAETETILEQQGHASISAEPLADSRFPLFTAPQKPVVPDSKTWDELCLQNPEMTMGDAIIRAAAWNACRDAMLYGAIEAAGGKVAE